MPERPLTLAIIGAGPTGASLVERVMASAPELLSDRPLHLELIDPERAGTGRVWRPDLSPLLWMNSLAEDVTMFTDDSVRCAGPIRPGPSFGEWAASVGTADLAAVADPAVAAEIKAVTPLTFPSRRAQAAYLEWFHRRTLADAPPTLTVTVRRDRVCDLQDGPDGTQLIAMESGGEPLAADVVVLCLGHLDAGPEDGGAHAAFARRHGLGYLPAGHTGDQDLARLAPGSTVVVSGFGQAFTDLMVLASEGRGGRFVEATDGNLSYRPSGDEPILVVGSRRGVPYRSKLPYRLQAPPPPLPRFFDRAAIDALAARPEPVQFWPDVFPLLAKDVAWGYYHELFVAHPARVTTTWDAFASRFEGATWGDEIDALVAQCVPNLDDRFDIERLNRPLEGLAFEHADDAHATVCEHIAADVARRTDPSYSADLGAFRALLVSFGMLAQLGATGALSDRSRVEDVAGSWFSFFMYYASGPPPQRLRQYLALAEAGLLRFTGAGLRVEADEGLGRFVGRSTSHPDPIVADAFVDARIAPPSVARTLDGLLGRLHARGDVVEEVVSDGTGWSVNTGRVVVSGPGLRLAHADGTVHPRRHAMGAFTNRPASGVLSRPGANAPTLRQSDTVARAVLGTLEQIGRPDRQHAPR